MLLKVTIYVFFILYYIFDSKISYSKIENYNCEKIKIHQTKFNTQLFDKVLNKDIISIKKIIKSGANINLVNNKGNNILLEFIEKQNKLNFESIEVIDYLIKSGININHQNKDGDTALILSSKKRFKTLTHLLLGYEPNINIRNKNHENVLYFNLSDKDLPKIIISKGLKIRKYELNKLMEKAIIDNNLELTKFFINKGAKLERINMNNVLENLALNSIDSNNDLKSSNKIKLISYLISKGFNINSRNKDMDSILSLSLVNPSYKFICFLLKKGSKVNITLKDGDKPISLASYTFNLKIIKLLLDYGASINAQNRLGNTPLHILSTNPYRNKSKLDYLIDKGASISIKNKDGKTAFAVALSYGWFIESEYYINKGFEVNSRDIEGNTPFLYAFVFHYDLFYYMKYFSKANFNERNRNGDTPLLLASVFADKQLIQYLIDKEANINDADNNGNTPLIIAVINKNKDAVYTLLLNGASPKLKNKEGKSVYYYINNQSYNEIEDILRYFNN